MDATRREGLRRLDAFVASGLQQYSRTRNFDRGVDDRRNVSMLSPYIRHRLILEPEIIAATLSVHSKSSSAKFIDEVFWRAYFKGWLQHHPTVWTCYRSDVVRLVDELAGHAERQEQYNQAISGNTGIDCFDAWARELVATGYLHNHSRMWFASIWIFTLGLPWQMGADFFLRHLLDGDPASNTLSWRWVGGLHTQGKTYLARVSNIANFTDGRFAPHGQLADHAEPLSEDATHEIHSLEFPAVESPGKRFGLLLTEDDLSSAGLLGDHQPQTVLGLAATRRRSPLPVGVHAYAFATQAVEGAVKETSEHFGVSGKFVEADDWADQLADWALHHKIDSVVVARPTIGPSQEALDDARSALDGHGIRIIELARDYDRETWPHANRGYFKLKKQSDKIIERLGLNRSKQSPTSRSVDSGQRDFIDELAS